MVARAHPRHAIFGPVSSTCGKLVVAAVELHAANTGLVGTDKSLFFVTRAHVLSMKTGVDMQFSFAYISTAQWYKDGQYQEHS